MSSHLRVLRTSGLVHERREGRHRLYRLDVDGAVRDAFVFLQSILNRGVAGIEAAHAPGDHCPADRADGRSATG